MQTRMHLMLPLLILTAHFLPGVAATASAVAVDESILYRDTQDYPPVVFSHQAHKQAGVDCKGCHPKVFRIGHQLADKGNAMTMLSLLQGKFCGACHNGRNAFKAGDKGTCHKCHVQGRK